MKTCEFGHEYLFECIECKTINSILLTSHFKKNDDILMRYLKTGDKSVLESLSNGQDIEVYTHTEIEFERT